MAYEKAESHLGEQQSRYNGEHRLALRKIKNRNDSLKGVNTNSTTHRNPMSSQRLTSTYPKNCLNRKLLLALLQGTIPHAGLNRTSRTCEVMHGDIIMHDMKSDPCRTDNALVTGTCS